MIWSLHSPTEMPKVRKIKRMASYIKFLTSLCVCMVMCMQAQACVQVDMFTCAYRNQRPTLGIMAQSCPPWFLRQGLSGT